MAIWEIQGLIQSLRAWRWRDCAEFRYKLSMSSIAECLLLSIHGMDIDALILTAQRESGMCKNPAAKQHRGAAHSDVTCCGRDAHPYKEPLKEKKRDGSQQPSV